MTVVINSPTSGATLSGVSTVTATYNGPNFSVATVTVDGVQLASDSSLPISFTIDTTKVADGTHTLTVAVKYKKSGNSYRWDKASIPVTVKKPNQTTITTNLSDGATLSGQLVWTATVTGGTASKVDFLIDGVVKWTELSALYQFNGDPDGKLDTNTLSNGSHNLTVKATMSGGSTIQKSIFVTVNNQVSPPTGNVARSNPTQVITS